MVDDQVVTELIRAGGLGGGVGSVLYSDKPCAPTSRATRPAAGPASSTTPWATPSPWSTATPATWRSKRAEFNKERRDHYAAEKDSGRFDDLGK